MGRRGEEQKGDEAWDGEAQDFSSDRLSTLVPVRHVPILADLRRAGWPGRPHRCRVARAGGHDPRGEARAPLDAERPAGGKRASEPAGDHDAAMHQPEGPPLTDPVRVDLELHLQATVAALGLEGPPARAEQSPDTRTSSRFPLAAAGAADTIPKATVAAATPTSAVRARVIGLPLSWSHSARTVPPTAIGPWVGAGLRTCPEPGLG